MAFRDGRAAAARSAGWLVVVVVLAVAGCAGRSEAPVEPFPSVIALDTGDTLRLGHVLPGAPSGRIHVFRGRHLPYKTEQVFVEADTLGTARSFELWYVAGTRYAEVVAYYEQHLGAPVRRFARLAGECTVWEEGGYAFDLCRSREPEEHGEVIAHLHPVPE